MLPVTLSLLCILEDGAGRNHFCIDQGLDMAKAGLDCCWRAGHMSSTCERAADTRDTPPACASRQSVQHVAGGEWRFAAVRRAWREAETVCALDSDLARLWRLIGSFGHTS